MIVINAVTDNAPTTPAVKIKFFLISPFFSNFTLLSKTFTSTFSLDEFPLL